MWSSPRAMFRTSTRRLSAGRLSELLGDAALATDLESRGTGMTVVLERTLARFTDEQRARFSAFAEGASAYAEDVRARRALPPRELERAAPLLFGIRNPGDLMADFELRDVAALAGLLELTHVEFRTRSMGVLEVVGDVASFAALMGLTYLYLGGTDVHGDVALLAGLTQLTTLNVMSTNVYVDAWALRSCIPALREGGFSADMCSSCRYNTCRGMDFALATACPAGRTPPFDSQHGWPDTYVGSNVCACCSGTEKIMYTSDDGQEQCVNPGVCIKLANDPSS